MKTICIVWLPHGVESFCQSFSITVLTARAHLCTTVAGFQVDPVHSIAELAAINNPLVFILFENRPGNFAACTIVKCKE